MTTASHALIDGSTDAHRSVRNAAKLGSSLVLTWGVALGVRILLPRYLGPEQFGVLNHADALATTAFVLVGLGTDVYVRKEVSVRPEHASEFFGGILLVRALLCALVFVGVDRLLVAWGMPAESRLLAAAFGAAQVFVTLNTTQSALLHARGTVDGLSIVNVATKVVWAGAVLTAIGTGQPPVAFPLALLGGEVLKTVALHRLTRRHLDLRLRVDLRATRAAVVASLPFWLNAIVTVAMSRIDVNVLALVVDDSRELGFYGAAANLANFGLMLAPVVGWVVMPLFARAAARSAEELSRTLTRTVELLLAVAAPVGLLLYLGAELVVAVMLGPEYGPSTAALRVLAPVLPLTYVAMVSSSCLLVLGRGWAATAVTAGGLLLAPALVVAMVPVGVAHLGGAGAGCALAMLLSELAVAGVLTALLGRRSFDRRSLDLVARTIGVCAAVLVLDRLVAGLGLVRIAVDAAAYVLLAVAFRAVRWQELIAFARSARRSREAP